VSALCPLLIYLVPRRYFSFFLDFFPLTHHPLPSLFPLANFPLPPSLGSFPPFCFVSLRRSLPELIRVSLFFSFSFRTMCPFSPLFFLLDFFSAGLNGYYFFIRPGKNSTASAHSPPPPLTPQLFSSFTEGISPSRFSLTLSGIPSFLFCPCHDFFFLFTFVRPIRPLTPGLTQLIPFPRSHISQTSRQIVIVFFSPRFFKALHAAPTLFGFCSPCIFPIIGPTPPLGLHAAPVFFISTPHRSFPPGEQALLLS